MKHEVKPSHAAPSHAAPAGHAQPVVSEFASLLGQAVGGVESAPPEESLFEGLLAGTLGSGKRRRLVLCWCGDINCAYSHYINE
jgi:hypothetical protein